MTTIISSGCGQPKITNDTSTDPSLCGEDSFFICAGKGCGVADGVGGWNNVGVSPAFMSRQLMLNCLELCVEDTTLDPKFIMMCAYNKIVDDKEVFAGSTTCSIILYDSKNSLLKCGKLGDSGYLIVRDSEILVSNIDIRTYPEKRPDQIGIVPKMYAMDDDVKFDDFSILEQYEYSVKIGDIIILGSDGLWDNMNPVNLLDHVRNFKSCDKLAEELVDCATSAWLYPDDITVVVSQIVEQPDI